MLGRCVIVCVALVGAGALGLGGCNTSGSRQRDAATSSMSTLMTQLQDAKTRVQEVVTAMSQVEATASTDPRPAFANFEASASAVETQAENIRFQTNAMRVRTQQFYDEWQKELETVGNETLRQRAIERREESKANFARIKETMESARDAYEPFISDLRDLRTVLRNDLTPGGVASLSDLMRETGREAGALMERIDAAIEAIATARSSMATPRAR